MPFRQRMSAVLAAVMLILAGSTPTTRAAVQPVSIAGFSFNPATLSITVGDSVTWTNTDPVAHTITSDTSIWNSGPLSQSGTFQHTFTQPGIFLYFCSIHSTMRGTILVGTQTYLPLVQTK
jgi:plastocyanin